MLERLELGNFERMLFITLFGLMAAVVNLGVNLRAAPGAVSGGGGYVTSYDSPIVDNFFTVQEIKPLELIPVTESTLQAGEPAQTLTAAPTPQQEEQIKQEKRETARNNMLNKLL